MLKLSIVSGGRESGDWTDGSGWRTTDSWVRPLIHPALEHALFTNGCGWLMVVRERGDEPLAPWWVTRQPVVRVDTAMMRRIRQETDEWPLDVLRVERDEHGTVTLVAGVWGIAPVYLTTAGGILRGSWDYRDLLPFVQAENLVDRVVARALTYWRRYEAQTAFAGVYQLTERARATFDDDGLTIRYPPAAMHARPRRMRADADAVAAFDVLLTRAVERRAAEPSGCAVALSGGVDSANVAMTLARLNPGRVCTAAVLIEGAAGRQQRRRREQMITAGGFVGDHRVHGLDHLPLSPTAGMTSGGPAYPDEEPFGAALAAMTDRLVAVGVYTLFGGTGGDELMSLRENERAQSLEARWWVTPDWLTARAVEALRDGERQLAPASVVSEVTLLGFASGNPLFVRRGVWPIDPLADPQLIRFAEWLPATWRRRKRLLRQRLARLGLPREVVDPPLRENLAGIMGAGLRRYGLPLLRDLLRGGVALVDLGFVDGQRLAEALARADSVADSDLDRRLYPVIVWELAVRALAGRTIAVPAQRVRDTPL